MKPEKLTIARLEKEWGPSHTWHGNCFALATEAQRVLRQGKVAYGHYLGPIAATGFWRDRRGLPFVQHGWVKLHDGRVLDPTRWSFLDESPAIWIGAADEYDQGGQKFRAACRRPAPDDNAAPNKISMETLSAEAAHHIDALLGRDTTGEINYAQAMWLASGPVDHLGVYARELFTLLISKGWAGAIPIDSRKMVMK